MNEQQIKKIPIRTEVLDAMLNYLSTQPYKDVIQLISAIQMEVQQAQTAEKMASLPVEASPKPSPKPSPASSKAQPKSE